MRVLIDTNIILDFLLQREPFFADAENLFQAVDSDRITGYSTATALTDIFYIAHRTSRSLVTAREAVNVTLTALEICPVDRLVLVIAFRSHIADFEDAVQIACAEAQGLDAILTRNMKDFKASSIPVLSVQECLKQIN